MQEPYWQFPNNILSAFRCTEVQYANEFLKNGSIKFNSPNNWVKYAKNGRRVGGICWKEYLHIIILLI